MYSARNVSRAVQVLAARIDKVQLVACYPRISVTGGAIVCHCRVRPDRTDRRKAQSLKVFTLTRCNKINGF